MLLSPPTTATLPVNTDVAQYPSRLWKVVDPERTDVKPSFLLGTMHLADKEIVALPPHIDTVVQQADSLTIEVKLGNDAFKVMSELSALDGPKTLSDLLGEATFDRVVTVLKPHGVNRYGLERLKPWVVGLMLNYPPPSLDPVLDYSLQMRFSRSNRPVHQLETIHEQIQIFNKLSLSDQIKFLRYALAQQANFDTYLERMKQLYIADDLDGLQALAKTQMQDVKEAYLVNLFQELIDKRNLRMVARMENRLEEGNALIAVGALHLTGDYGIIQLLRDLGYQVNPVTP